MPIVAIDIAKITYGTNRRPVNDEKVRELMESIKANGLLNPIILDQKYNLIAGLHRLTACQMLGFNQIQCNVINYEDDNHARLAEIDENLIRNELSALERAELCLERERILEQMGLRARPGNNQYTQKGGETISPPVKTTLDLAKGLGVTERTFQQDKQIARDIAPEVKAVIMGTPIAERRTDLLKIARAGKQEREKAEKAEKLAHIAKNRQNKEDAQRQDQLAAEARAKQKELQIIAFQNLAELREARLVAREFPSKSQQQLESKSPSNVISTQPGDRWLLDRHLVYCGDTANNDFMNLVRSDAALAIATPSATWNHDYLIQEARVVAVLRKEGYIHEFCNLHQMPFRFELVIGDLYVAIFSRYSSIPAPRRPITIEGLEGIVSYLVNLYTNQGNFVIAPFVGHGEVIITCERMNRVCFAGDESPELVKSAILRWQNWTERQAVKMH